MTTLDMDKRALRKALKRQRDALDIADRTVIDASICDQLTSLDIFKSSELLLCYLSFGSEVDTRRLILRSLAAGKTVALPRCVRGHGLAWYRIDGLEGLVANAYGIEEPVEDPTRLIEISDFTSSLSVVPGLTFDAEGRRLGYGGGYYDRFLSSFAGMSVGIIRRVQLSRPGLIPWGIYDRTVGLVVCEDGILDSDVPLQYCRA